MLTFLILLLLCIGFYAGARRGILLQLIYTTGYSLSFLCAWMNYKSLATKIELYIPYPAPSADSQLVFFDSSLLLKLDQAFYAGFAFLLIVFLGYLVTKFVGLLCYSLTFAPIAKEMNFLIGGFLNLFMVYVAITLILYVIAMIPLDGIQNIFNKSLLASFMVEKTPFLSKNLYQWWIVSVIQ